LFLKDLEKSLVGNQDAYTSLKSKLENLPEKVIVMGSHTQIDNRKEKVILWQIFWYLYLYIWLFDTFKFIYILTIYIYIFYDQSHAGGLLFTKFGGNHTALLDLAFPVCKALP
jgi:hypothetical protein